MNKLEKRIMEDITINFLERFKSKVYSENELDFFRSVCISYLRKELNTNIYNHLRKIFAKENILFLNNIDFISNHSLTKDDSENAISLKIDDIYFITVNKTWLVIYNYEIDKINSFVEEVLNNIKVS